MKNRRKLASLYCAALEEYFAMSQGDSDLPTLRSFEDTKTFLASRIMPIFQCQMETRERIMQVLHELEILDKAMVKAYGEHYYTAFYLLRLISQLRTLLRYSPLILEQVQREFLNFLVQIKDLKNESGLRRTLNGLCMALGQLLAAQPAIRPNTH